MSVDPSGELRSSQSNSTDSFASALVDSLLNSLSLQLALGGLVVTIGAYIVDSGGWPDVSGVWPAIISIWGIALVLVGAGTYLAIRYSRRSSRD